jgi:hypothetical protein
MSEENLNEIGTSLQHSFRHLQKRLQLGEGGRGLLQLQNHVHSVCEKEIARLHVNI